MIITDPVFYLVAIPAVILTGISKGGFGSAFGGISVPLMALAISPMQAAAILLPVLCFMDLVGFRAYYGKWDLANLKIMVPGALCGIAIGSLTFGSIKEAHVRIAVGSIAVLFTVHQWLNLAARQSPASRSVTKGAFWSGVSGLTSFLAHAGGPPAQVYMLPQKMEKTTYVATVNLFFMIVNMVKLVPYAWLGQFSSANLWTALLLAPFVPVGVNLGMWLQKQAGTIWFYRIARVCLLLTGLQLIYQGIIA
jgi:uncharacterized membrane protein YfcA